MEEMAALRVQLQLQALQNIRAQKRSERSKLHMTGETNKKLKHEESPGLRCSPEEVRTVRRSAAAADLRGWRVVDLFD